MRNQIEDNLNHPTDDKKERAEEEKNGAKTWSTS